MVSRWNYIAITAVMAVTFFLFQFTNIMLESWNHYEENPYVCSAEKLPGSRDAYLPEEADSGRRTVIYIGGEEEPAKDVVYAWAAYTKRNASHYAAWEQLDISGWRENGKAPEMIVVDARHIGKEEVGTLQSCAEEGVCLVFCHLPETAVTVQSEELQELLGIAAVRAEETTVDGLHLHEGFLLGGEVDYYTKDAEENARRQDMELTFPWYELVSGTKVYMNGFFEETSTEEEDLPAVLWRNRYEGTDIFVVNGEYMDEASGIGILSAVSAVRSSCEIYPVVNAQNLIVTNYPELSEENETAAAQRYGRTTAEMLRDFVWPAVIAAYRQNTLGLTCMLAPQFDYEDDNWPDAERFLYYMQRLNEENAETGLSGYCVSDTSVVQKLRQDQAFMEGALPEYRFTSFYAGGLTESETAEALQEELLSDVRTIVTTYEEAGSVIGYQNEKVTRQSILTDGVRHTYREDFRNRCIETALGYTSVSADMSKMIYPSEDRDELTELTSYLGWNLRYYFEGFRGFEGTTLSESDARIRNFLTLDYAWYREDNAICLNVKNVSSPVWFLLRCRGQAPAHMEGGAWQRFEKDVYLIRIEEENAVITLKAGRN